MTTIAADPVTSGDEELFAISYEGKALQIHWRGLPPLTRSPASRICNVGDTLLLLTTDHALYSSHLQSNRSSLDLQLLRTDVLDVDFCSGSQELFVVLTNGSVQWQIISGSGRDIQNPHAWQTLSFDPLELLAEGVRIRRVCSSAQGVVFVDSGGETYVMGSCGEVFNTEQQPRHMRLYEESKELLDLAAGKEHFVMLVAPYNRADEALQLPALHSKEDAEDEQASVKSLSSGNSERSFAANTRHLLHQGYALLHTQLFTFGASNNGLLGTGDHIRRANVARLQKVDSMGVCSIAAGLEHTVARTLDGRLYHWGLNSHQQLGEDMSSPNEITISDQTASLPANQVSALEATCGDYHTILLNASGHIQSLQPQPSLRHNQQSSTYAQTMLQLQLGAAWPRQLRLLMCSGGYTLQNQRKFQRQYHYYLSHLQSQLQMLLNHRQAVLTLDIWQRQSTHEALCALGPLLVSWERMLCLLVATLHSLEGFYRADFVQPADLLFICHHKEYIELFNDYTKSYCDVYSVNGFCQAVAAIAKLNGPLAEENYVTSLFQQPFSIYQLFVQFMELLVRTQPEYGEHRVAWAEFARHCCISQELAVNTRDFWISNERNPRIVQFRRRQRRVILTSSLVPLKLVSSVLSMSSFSYILFSDFLCQVGVNSLYSYPLTTLWVWSEGEFCLRLTTPEKSFVVATRTQEMRKVWLDQLQSSIVSALGRPLGSPVPIARSTGYEFSREHPKFSGVKACGTWRKGVLHGNCYLEYPDGSVYCGELHLGVIEGYGKMVIPSTGIYVGNFKGGRFHGHGVYEIHGKDSPESEIYEGNFCDGRFHGHGMMRNNRYMYVGEYQGNARSGYGVMEDLVTGDKYMGMFVDNKRFGIGNCITNRGDYFEGSFAGDDLVGNGVAVFENDNYYEGELTLRGPNGRGEYYMPSGDAGGGIGAFNASGEADESCELIGNKIFGQLSGSWETVRIQSGELVLNRRFHKYPSSLGRQVVDHNRKWRSLFQNFESDLENCTVNSSTIGGNASAVPDGSLRKLSGNSLSTTQLWTCIAAYISKQRNRDGSKPGNYFNNILLSMPLPHKASSPLTKARYTTNTLNKLQTEPASALDFLGFPLRRIHSQETVNSKPGGLQRADSLLSMGHNSLRDLQASSLSSFQLNQSLLNRTLNGDESSTLGESFAYNNNSISKHMNSSDCSITTKKSTSAVLDQVPSFGMAATLTEQDVVAIRLYLEQAFKNRHHPLYALNDRIANCFHFSYGYWKVKPTPILAKQAMREWESISRRIYRFVRKMFPALPEDYCHMEASREVISHITLLYPLVLSEGIYSTLFVLYANKYSRKDEMYRQNLNYAEKLKDPDLVELMGHESFLRAVMLDPKFQESVQMLKQLQEKFSPQDMLTVIQRSTQLLTEAYEHAMAANAAQLNADNMIPLTMLTMLRAAVPHLGAELALLDDLTGGPNFQAEMNGMAGYCYTTLKAAYEHVTLRALQKIS
ncbi:hypothetical protein KR009_011712 [Drosophila setifemur]|nr:hypothetical protein KR009_011712 [Drosophila setifemur]